MKKKNDWGLMLLPAGYLLFAVAVFIAFSSLKRPVYPAEEKIRNVFEENFEAFNDCARMLWSHPEYFDDLYERTGVQGLVFNTEDTLARGNEAGLLAETDWDQVVALCALIQPYEIALRPNDVNAVEWVYMVQEPDGAYYSLDFYYVRPADTLSPEEAPAALDAALGYLGQFYPLSPMEGKDFWYVSVTAPADSQ